MLNLNDLKVGDSVRFKNGQVAKVVEIEDKDETSVRLYFNKKVASDVFDSEDVYDSYWYYDLNGECSGCTNHIIEIMKKVDLTSLKIGDAVRFKNGQVAKVVDIKRFGEKTLHLFFDEEVASVVDEPQPVYSSEWYYKLETGGCSGCDNHIIEIIKKGEEK